MSLAPDSLRRRSFVHRELSALGANFAEVAGAAAALDLGDADGEAEAAKVLALADLSALPRAGYKGALTVPWLGARGVHVGEADNLAYRQEDGSLAARLAPTEVLLLANLDGGGPFAALAAAWSMDDGPGAYPVPRQGASAWFLVSGRHAPAMFAKLCGVDLRPEAFAELAVAQTSVARLGAIVIRDDLGPTSAYHLLADSASASYLWACLLDAMDEFSGRPVGLTAIRRLGGNRSAGARNRRAEGPAPA